VAAVLEGSTLSLATQVERLPDAQHAAAFDADARAHGGTLVVRADGVEDRTAIAQLMLRVECALARTCAVRRVELRLRSGACSSAAMLACVRLLAAAIEGTPRTPPVSVTLGDGWPDGDPRAEAAAAAAAGAPQELAHTLQATCSRFCTAARQLMWLSTPCPACVASRAS
jgi:hypothetical protein